jgi:hypothetical protein
MIQCKHQTEWSSIVGNVYSINFPFQVDRISVDDVNQVPITSGGNNVDELPLT